MFFEKCTEKFIDGVTYPVSNPTQVEMWNCKSKIVEVYNMLEGDQVESELTFEN